MELTRLLIILAITMGANYSLGVYKNVSILKFKFDWVKAVNGIIKAMIIAGSVYGFSYSLAEMVKLGYEIPGDVIAPTAIIVSAILLYLAKGGAKLMEVLGVKEIKANKIEKEEKPVEKPEPKPEIKNPITYPTKIMRIMQDYNGSTSHIYHRPAFPIDETGNPLGVAGKAPMYCPADEVIIKRVHEAGADSTVWLQTVNKVTTPEFEDYVTIKVVHVDINGLVKGKTFNRGEFMFESYKNHFHITQARGKFEEQPNNGWVKNKDGKWTMTKNILKPEQTYYFDKSFTELVDCKGLDFKYLP